MVVCVWLFFLLPLQLTIMCPYLCGHADKDSWASRAMKPQGRWIIPTVARVGPGAWRGTIHFHHDEPGSGGIDLARPEEVRPEAGLRACWDYL